MTKTYEELEVDLHFAEHELEKAKTQCGELTNALDDAQAELEKTQAKLARVKSKTCKDCAKLFEEMAEKWLASRSCENCKWNRDKLPACTRYIRFFNIFSTSNQNYYYHEGIDYCSLWEAKK